ncbi:MAG TPA: lysylphosphatidylglycerol synthase transmembrane domain-containing protein [Solirubrobacteraceae bacterium]|nr:lysylphosphatidylglycerol synthase transmembrane domain-containing protein [Solirubrobacteraceae bacterium]
MTERAAATIAAGTRADAVPDGSQGEISADESSPAPANRRARRLRWTFGALLGLAISAGSIYIATRKVSLHEISTSLANAHYVWLIPSIALTYVALWLRGVRWQALFLHRDNVSQGACFHSVSIGLMFNNILPSRAGEVVRVLAVRRATGVSAVEAGMTIVVERLLDVFILAIGGVILWPLLPDRTWINVLGLVCSGVIVGFIALVIALTVFRQKLPQLLIRLLVRLPFISDRRAQSVREAIGLGTGIMLRPVRLAEACGLTALIWALVGLSSWVLFPAFSLHTSGLAPWLLLIANSFAMTVPSSPGTVGVYEASVQAALTAFGVSKGHALSYALVLHAVNFFPIILTGLISTAVIGMNVLHPGARGATPVHE